MTLEKEKVESKIACPKCGKLNPLDTSRCIYCKARTQIEANQVEEVTDE